MPAFLAAPAILTRAYADTPSLRTGLVSPRTGPLAGLAEADDYILQAIAEKFGSIQNNGKGWAVQILSKDNQLNPCRAAEVASELNLQDEVDLIVAASTLDTVNPVSDQAEVNGVPCITTGCPWQPCFFGRGGRPDEGFVNTCHFFWGLEEVTGAFLDLWGQSGWRRWWAASSPTMPTAMPGGMRNWGCRGRWRRRGMRSPTRGVISR